MLSLSKLIIFTTALASYASATTYAQFCNNGDCTEGCGISVSVDNPGCLNENGRVAIKFHDTNLGAINLVTSPGPDCPCQNYCYSNIVEPIKGGTEGCFPLTGPDAQSFRFQTEVCPENNC
ncbi:Hypothetical protein R9X50_00073100 [Acrodontium crateriforme]|uniref:Uncharacterized protein n=1 Tax=Acrodontium crateriforme TaxID=150365 RepID=A0AAQ3LXV2_9PEZI|nr:Hypothetical protein R9X50_00073100 [Acrodontium crateriforme]